MTEPTRLCAVFDTNVIIAALKSRSATSPNYELLRRWQNSEFDLRYCFDLEAEYREKLIARNVEATRRTDFLAGLRGLGHFVHLNAGQISPIITADPDDDIVLACALVGRATHLVTYDPHLLGLGSSYQDIAILDGLHFLYAVRGDSPAP
jgi:predicted nucleic acid-binding protein